MLVPRGVDSSYHIRIDTSLRRGTIWGIAYIVYVRERLFFLVCIYNKGTKNFEVKVDVQKGA